VGHPVNSIVVFENYQIGFQAAIAGGRWENIESRLMENELIFNVAWICRVRTLLKISYDQQRLMKRIVRMLGYLKIFAGKAANPGSPSSELPLLTADETHRCLWSGMTSGG